MFAFSLIALITSSYAQDNCQWSLQFQDQSVTLDLSALSGSIIYLQEEQPNDQYYLEFTPCSNNISCSCYSSIRAMTAQITDTSNPAQCSGVLSVFDAKTKPSFSLSSDGLSQFEFVYPAQPSTCAQGCDSGRQQSITYICDKDGAEPYNKGKSRFYESARVNGICQYHLELYTKAACTSVNITGDGIKWILTSTDETKKFEMQYPLIAMNGSSNRQNIININEQTTYQKMYGFGAAVK